MKNKKTLNPDQQKDILNVLKKINYIGGLENQSSDQTEVVIDDDTYITGKFRYLLREMFIDWEMFLQIYEKNISEDNLYNQVVRMLNIKDNENLRPNMLNVVERVYKMKPENHISCMLRQFMLYEPVSLVIHSTFMLIKNHYEDIIKCFVETRNFYISEKKLSNQKMDWHELVKQWNTMNNHYKFDSSSPILLFINPPNKIKKMLDLSINDKKTEIEDLKKDLSNFHYAGFCPKVPHKRLIELLKFPVEKFKKIILSMNPNLVFPDYILIEKKIKTIISEEKNKPTINITLEYKTPPKELTEKIHKHHKFNTEHKECNDARIELIKWYVNEILATRKQLIPIVQEFEKYYTELSKIINNVLDILKKEFKNINIRRNEIV